MGRAKWQIIAKSKIGQSSELVIVLVLQIYPDVWWQDTGILPFLITEHSSASLILAFIWRMLLYVTNGSWSLQAPSLGAHAIWWKCRAGRPATIIFGSHHEKFLKWSGNWQGWLCCGLSGATGPPTSLFRLQLIYLLLFILTKNAAVPAAGPASKWDSRCEEAVGFCWFWWPKILSRDWLSNESETQEHNSIPGILFWYTRQTVQFRRKDCHGRLPPKVSLLWLCIRRKPGELYHWCVRGSCYTKCSFLSLCFC